MKLRATAPLTTNQKRNPIQKRKTPPTQQGISKRPKPLYKRKNKGKKPKWVPRYRILKAEEQVATDNIEHFLSQEEPKLLRFLVWGLEKDEDYITYNELRQVCEEKKVTGPMMEDWRNRYATFVTENLHPVWEKSMEVALDGLKKTILPPSYYPTAGLFMEHLQKLSSTRITVVTDTVRKSIAYLLAEHSGVQGLSADKTAQYIRPYIYLNRPQVQANKNYFEAMKKNLRENNPTMSKEDAEEKARAMAKIKAEKQHRYRATMIARTELANSYNVAQYRAVEDAMSRGILGDMVKVWCTSNGERICGVCEPLNGEVREMKELFSCGLLIPILHPNCHCVVRYEDRFLHSELEKPKTDTAQSSHSREKPSGEDGEVMPSPTTTSTEKPTTGTSTTATGKPSQGQKNPSKPVGGGKIPDQGLTGGGNGGTMNTDSKDGKIQFVPVATIPEAAHFANRVLGIPNVSYKGCAIEVANEWNKGLTEYFNNFPELKKNFGFVGECHERNKLIKAKMKEKYDKWYVENNPNFTSEQLAPYIKATVEKNMKNYSVSRNTFAQSLAKLDIPEIRDYSGITINRDQCKDVKALIASLTEQVEQKSSPLGCTTIRSLLDHEIGHQLDDLLGLRDNPDIKVLFDSRSMKEITEDLCSYAWNNTNSNLYSEMIAEAWSEYCNSSTPRKIAETVGRIIEEEYKKLVEGR